MNKRKIFSVLVICICITSIFFDSNYWARSSEWKYSDGHHIGDIVSFNGPHIIKNNQIYYGDSIVAKIVDIDFKSIDIVSPDGKEGYYCYFD